MLFHPYNYTVCAKQSYASAIFEIVPFACKVLTALALYPFVGLYTHGVLLYVCGALVLAQCLWYTLHTNASAYPCSIALCQAICYGCYILHAIIHVLPYALF
jgi:hypothetical protein